jgi:nitrate/TMAO reductase-like tetraheme cytochrome c subunit
MTQPFKPGSNFNNWISAIGAVLAAGALFSFALLVWMDLTGEHSNPYLGIFTYMVAPGFLITGLAIIFFGAWAQRRWAIKHAATVPDKWRLDFTDPRQRRLLVLFGLGGGGFLLLSAFGSYQSYHYVGSNEFCGAACHSAVYPEYTTYQRGAHARVNCVECHVGSGAKAFVAAKLEGTSHLIAFATDNYSRPIAPPVHGMRPPSETCEKCHWPEKAHGNIDLVFDHYLSKRNNDAYSVRMLMHVTNGRPGGPEGGSHWHVNPNNVVEFFATDENRQEVAWVRVTDKKSGATRVFRDEEFKGEPAAEHLRRMDCLDCHNRPAHQFATANDSVEQAMTSGAISTALPFAKRSAVQALIQEEITTDAAAPAMIAEFLKGKFKDHADAPAAIAEVQRIFATTMFPERKADWRQYPNNLGHKNSAGCFRCHDTKLKSAEGKTIGASDCTSCHTIIAQGTAAELAAITIVGQPFKHPDGEYDEELRCADCHNGGIQGK